MTRHRLRAFGRGSLLLAMCMASVAVSRCASGAPGGDALRRGFAEPPASARPHTWWHWMNGNISRDGITADLEEMARVGIGGAQIFDVDCGLPSGPVPYGTDEWRAMVHHALATAERLGLEMCMHNCAGWSSSGGPWIDAAHSMQILVFSERRVTGPGRIEEPLAEPWSRRGYLRDVAVLAFPTPNAEAANDGRVVPVLTSNSPGFDPVRLVDQNLDTGCMLSAPPGGNAFWVQFEYPAPFTARSVTVAQLDAQSGQRGVLEASDDGTTWREVCEVAIPTPEITPVAGSTTFEPARARFFRLSFVRRGVRAARVALAELSLSGGARLRGWAEKSGYTRQNDFAPDATPYDSGLCIAHEGVLDLTHRLAEDGTLNWEVPAGDWTILRIGSTTTGKENHPATEAGRGLECDKLSREAVDLLFGGVLAPIMDDIGPLAGKGLHQILVDSYEVGSQNWTPEFPEEFRKRRGYDPLPFLPAMAGRIVDSTEVTERFLWDVRRTIADLYADNYWGRFAELCHAHNLKLATEPYGNGNFDDMQAGGRADIVMTEFWSGSGGDYYGAKQVSSIAHAYGTGIVGAEAFTADSTNGKWLNHPASIKALGDAEYAAGVNRFIFHRYAHQPWDHLVPGMTMGPWGMHFERTVTFWDQSTAWLRYLARCQYLLQAGLFHADVCYYKGENAPSSLPGLSLPAGYDYDGCDTEVLLNRMSVRKGRIVLPDGMSYRLLVLHPSETMSPRVLARLRDLVRDGATLVGPRPSRSPSLEGYPACDVQVRETADEVWGDCDGQNVMKHPYGRGVVYWGMPIEQVLAECGLAPDFEATADGTAPHLRWIHRTAGDTDYYFVSNQKPLGEVVECTFRVSGRVPELWHPDTGRCERAPLYRANGGRTTVTLPLGPMGSVFVVFRAPASGGATFTDIERDGVSALALQGGPKHTLTIDRAIYGVLASDVPDCVDLTEKVQAALRDGRVSVPATNAFAGVDPAPNVVKQLRVDYTIANQPLVGVADENETLSLPRPTDGAGDIAIVRALYGLVPPGPYRPIGGQTVDVTEAVAALVRDGTLVVTAGNELGGDPANLVRKQMRVDYTLDGKRHSRTIQEGATLQLPEGTASPGFPAAELECADDGSALLVAWLPGTYELTSSSGRKRSVEVTHVPDPAEVAGPWDLSFPPGLGAPARVALDQLISWTDHPDEGVRYFSGTATYVTHVDIAAHALADGQRVALDLGDVREIAEVRLNGTDLGILWKPPFRVDVTSAAKPGRNRLEVRVTNLWPNRLIGDEQLPPDAEYSPGGPIRAWPEWLVKGTPRPATGRVTFTTWQHWTKDSPLLESGLLGPVTLHLARVVPVGKP